jgi:hypothetical protein
MRLVSKAIILLMLAGFISCDRNSIYEEEKYKPVIYLLSTSNMTYSEVYTLKEETPVKFFSIGCGGSLPNPEEVTITLEADTVLLSRYNKSSFDIDSASFAKLLPENRYEIESMTVTLPANSPEQFVKVPVKVRPEGLSPDSIYFIPLAIKSVSRYEVNPEKRSVLFRVAIANDYAEQLKTTYYYMTGSTTPESGAARLIAGSRMVHPLTGNRVRVFAGAPQIVTPAKPTVAEIEKHSIVLQINDDKTVDFFPYKTIEVEKLADPRQNIYSVEGKERYVYLYYRFRTLTTPATETDPAVYSEWNTVKQTLRRLE